jgi:hypothetical protein
MVGRSQQTRRTGSSCLLLLLLWVSGPLCKAELYFDGGVHNVNSPLSGAPVVVFDDFGGNPTTLNWLPGAANGTRSVGVLQTSQFNMFGGSVGRNIFAFHSSRVNISGGVIENDIKAFGRSHVEVSGGVVKDDIEAYRRSTVLVTSGIIEDEIQAWGNSRVRILGGSIGDDIESYRRARVHLFGGSILDAIEASGRSRIFIHGSGFNYPYGPIPDLTGTLIGTLQTGGFLNNSFERFSPLANIVLVPVPTPSAFLLGLLGLGYSSYRLRKRKTSEKQSV